MDQYCQNCGTKLLAGAKFCPHCGGAVGGNSQHDSEVNRSNVDATAVADVNSNAEVDEPIVRSNVGYGPYNGSGNPGFKTAWNVWAESISANGCMGRADYWYGFAYAAGLNFIFERGLMFNVTIISIFMYLMLLFLGIVVIFASIQRVHDAGHSGWTILIPIVNVIYLLQPTNWSVTKWPRNDYSDQK